MSYLEQRRALKLAGKPSAKVERAEKMEKAKFFKEAIAKAPYRCQNCDASLAGTMAINPAAVVSHILPKRVKGGVPSVATNPLNKMYLCGDCHNTWDNGGERKVLKMKVLEFAKARVFGMLHEIKAAEFKNIPHYLLPEKYKPK